MNREADFVNETSDAIHRINSRRSNLPTVNGNRSGPGHDAFSVSNHGLLKMIQKQSAANRFV